MLANWANQVIQRSVETKKPVRVIRGFKVNSPYAPYEGYRYDGLYRVEKAWSEPGMSGLLVCKFAFKVHLSAILLLGVHDLFAVATSQPACPTPSGRCRTGGHPEHAGTIDRGSDFRMI
jgi:hypothetical protein